MYVGDGESVKLASHHFKDVARLSYDQWKKTRGENEPLLSWAMFEDAFMGCFFPRELRKA
ncbi:hypothetical protein MTR67_011809 [Solanum verrucosum]|uniref:Uncharacterized protein n=1 Tax=Solanum verrucosum TaxID=315347 RepID=A0AAF0QEJ6_SOLVR|nr:hypothetical protein MTR67_011809 [Solanum verrucosum]